MPEPLPARQFHIHLAQPGVRAPVNLPLPERPPPPRLATHRTSHGHDANAYPVHPERLWQFSLRLQGRTFGAPGLTTLAVSREDGREQSKGKCG